MTLATKVAELSQVREQDWAWSHYEEIVRDLIRETGARSVIEIGGGRAPSFSKEETERLGVSYTSNDISARELSKAPEWVGKAEFDVQSPDPSTIAPFADTFDFAFSKMVMEHVANYERAYTNLYRMLRPGGVTIAFHPVLYTMPFVINKLLPERASTSLLQTFFPHRNDDGIPKFPATYSGCVISPRVRRKLQDIGFKQVWQVPFYGHIYYRSLPIVRDIHRSVTRWAAKRDVTTLASFAYTIAVK